MGFISLFFSIIALWGYSFINTIDLPHNNTIPLESHRRSSNAIEVPQGRFFIIKKGDNYAAVKLTERIVKGDGGYNYEWYWQNDKSGDFTNKNVIKGKGEVFEKYVRTRGENNSSTVRDAGGIYYIKCKNIKVQWSSSRWIYLNSPTADIEIALTDKTKIEDIDYLNKDLKWNRKK